MIIMNVHAYTHAWVHIKIPELQEVRDPQSKTSPKPRLSFMIGTRRGTRDYTWPAVIVQKLEPYTCGPGSTINGLPEYQGPANAGQEPIMRNASTPYLTILPEFCLPPNDLSCDGKTRWLDGPFM